MSEFPEFLDCGEGPAVLFNHGTMMDATMFEPQMAYLARQGFRAVSLNSRAHRTKSRHSLKDLAEDTLRIADRLHIDQFTPVGMSVGAFASLELVQLAPDRCRGLVLIDGMAVGYTAEERALFGSRFAPLDIDGPLPPDFAEWMVPIIFGETACRENPELAHHWKTRWTTMTAARTIWSQWTSWCDKTDQTSSLKDIETPTLLIHGGEDAGITFSTILSMLPELSDLILLKVAKAGHASNLERPDAVNAMLGYFCQNIWAPQA